nr:hypothetical protein [Tanacetum cinerariifolium]
MASALIYLSLGQRFNFSKYIFESLVRNVDSSSKFYMYPRFIQLIIQTNIADLSKHTTRYISPVLTQKVFANMRRVGKGFSGVETPLFENMLAVRDVAKKEEAQTNIADLSKHTSRYISPVLTQKVFANMRRVGKGFSGVETPLFKTMLAVRNVVEEAEAQVPAQGDDVQEHAVEEVATDVVSPTPTSPSPLSPVISSSPPHQSPCPPQQQDAVGSSLLFQRVLDTCSALVLRVEGLENDKATQQLEIVKLKARVKKLEKLNKVKSSKIRRLKKVGTSQRVESSDDVENVFNQGRNIVDMDQDEGIKLVIDQKKDAEVEGRHADKQAEIYNIDLDHSSKVVSMQEDDTEVQEAIEIVTTAKLTWVERLEEIHHTSFP